ncbi:MAG: ROK family protein [Firmicutes bacterium]|nr:ROK family protein [Bacillota bacterium]
MEGKFFAALDVGGTKIYTVVANEKLQILAQQERPTAAAAGPKAVIEQIYFSLQQTTAKAKIKKNDLQAVGICIAGFYDHRRKLLRNSPNLKGWDDIALSEIMAKKIGLPVLVENDANAAALGEALYGAAYGHDNVVFITVSTGIGAGLILNNKIYRGEEGFAGELGHVIVAPGGPLCGCGQRGCLEAMASGTAIAREAQSAIDAHKNTILKKLAAEKTINAKDVFAAAAQNDTLAQDIVNKAFFYLAIGTANIINLLNPSVVVLGGGIMNNADKFLFQALQKNIISYTSAAMQNIQIKRAILGPEAGVKGMLGLLRANGEKGRS